VFVSALTAPAPPFDSASAVVERERTRIPGLAGLTLWRLLVAGTALLGVWLAALQYDVWWTALSQLSSLAAGVSYAALAAYPFLTPSRCDEPPSPWLRGALATLMLLVSIAYLAMTGSDLTQPYSVVEHLLTPALVVADFVLVGRNQSAVRWWHPVTWLLPPMTYLCYYVLGDLRVYAALDAGRPGPFALRVLMLVGLVLSASLLMYGVGRARRPGGLAPRSAARNDVRPPQLPAVGRSLKAAAARPDKDVQANRLGIHPNVQSKKVHPSSPTAHRGGPRSCHRREGTGRVGPLALGTTPE